MKSKDRETQVNLSDLTSVYILGFHYRVILSVIKLNLSEFGISESHTEVLRAISPLRAAIKRLLPSKEAVKLLEKLDTIYEYVTQLKYDEFQDKRHGDAIFNTIEDLCREVELSILEFSESTFNNRAAILFEIGRILSIWNYGTDPSFKLKDEVHNKLIIHLKAAKLQQTIKQLEKLVAIPDDEVFKHQAILWQAHQDIINQLENERAINVISKNANSTNINDLTGLPNYKQFEQDSRYYFDNPEQPVSVAFIDIDDLKSLNTKIGHDAVDEVIQRIASVLVSKLTCRAKVYHRSGDEFLAVLQNTTAKEAKLIFERIVDYIKHLEFASPKGVINVTICVGIAAYAEHSSDPDNIRKKANQAMFRSKIKGKARVTVWSGDFVK